MIRCSMAQAARWAGALGTSGDDATIHGVSTDSRSIGPGSLFVPLAGPRFDGHGYVEEAVRKGAAASLWRSDVPNPPQGVPLIFVEDTLAALQRLAAAYRRHMDVTVVGITGSNGKTSTKDILAGVLGVEGKTHKTRGNLNNHIGVPLTLLEMDGDERFAVVEMGMSAPGEIAQLAAIAQPQVGIITSVGHAHLEQMGSIEAIARAKWEIACAIGDDGMLIYPGECALLRRLAAQSGVPTRTFGEQPGDDFRLTSFAQSADGITFATADAGPLLLPMQGRHNARNALAAIVAARFLGLGMDAIAQGLRRVEPTGGRCQVYRAGDCTIIDDTYKSNPESVLAALELLYGMPGRRKLFIMGDMVDMGADSPALHRQIGAALDPARLDAVYACGEETVHTISQARQRFPEGRARHFSDREGLLAALREYVSMPGTVLVKASRARHFEDIALWLRQCKEAGHEA